jgi:heme/copper-type cytochrome/quinol oxidase subunit 2
MENVIILNKNLKKTLDMIAYIGKFFAFGMAFYMISLFMIAYTSAQKAVAFKINVFGEANLELPLMILAAILIIHWFVWSFLMTNTIPKVPENKNKEG